jgi:hypothetical protein
MLSGLLWGSRVITTKLIINVRRCAQTNWFAQVAALFRIHGVLNSLLGPETDRLEIFVGFLAATV